MSRGGRGGSAEAAPPCHSFVGTTLVLMADGSHKPISKVAVGDKIADAVPGGDGKTQAHAVGTVIVTKTDYDFVNLTIGSLDRSGHRASVGTVTTTAHHPFYDITQSAFVEAGALHAGDRLQQPDGRTAVVLAARLYRDTHTTTYDLTIPDLHTYYVLAGPAAVLVHNCGVTDSRGPGDAWEELQDADGIDHATERHTVDGPRYNPKRTRYGTKAQISVRWPIKREA
ncbi:hypothetical protein GCM10009765_83560 [Fodinicola feengrottensis]|uniref:Intein C-terminal splicing domain-containing protein n=2 Tax=Fodinicola feengrottensis TaxID=435914 RepID=A0ABP4VGH5_9ACTN